MNFLHWYDWIQPTTPSASIIFGILFTVIAAATVWFNTRKKKSTGIAFLTGLSVTAIGVYILVVTGFYS
ncbi:hypothetical protein SFC55_19140 [Niallia taxi]|uniref:hypothetical protein n=1 Tax=Niallia TaxID=2837506 RepID=UPI00203F5E92|nr:hypothetical protein [Niallia sp. MER 6]MCM3032809.1 hypothetical protein [Niallia sp. MER 6]